MPRITFRRGQRVGADELNAVSQQVIHSFTSNSQRNNAWTSSDPPPDNTVCIVGSGGGSRSMYVWYSNRWNSL